MTLGDVISKYRHEHSMSMADFSKVSGISKAYISMLEKNKTQRGEEPAPSIEMYRNVADAIGIDVDELVRMVDGKVTISFAPPAPNLLPAPAFVRKPRLGRVACGQPILAREELLRECIKEKYGSVLEFSKASGIPNTTIRNIFNRGLDGVGVGTVLKICNALELDMEELMNGRLSIRLNPQKDAAWAQYVQNANIGKSTVSDDDIKFALFGGDGEITDSMYDEVKRFAQMVKLREEAERKE